MWPKIDTYGFINRLMMNRRNLQPNWFEDKLFSFQVVEV